MTPGPAAVLLVAPRPASPAIGGLLATRRCLQGERGYEQDCERSQVTATSMPSRGAMGRRYRSPGPAFSDLGTSDRQNGHTLV
jgi:hypothetical protein